MSLPNSILSQLVKLRCLLPYFARRSAVVVFAAAAAAFHSIACCRHPWTGRFPVKTSGDVASPSAKRGLLWQMEQLGKNETPCSYSMLLSFWNPEVPITTLHDLHFYGFWAGVLPERMRTQVLYGTFAVACLLLVSEDAEELLA